MPEKQAMKWIGAVLGVLAFYLLVALWHQYASDGRSAFVAEGQVDIVSGSEPIRPVPLAHGLAEISRFDRSLRGDNTVLTAEEAEGYRLFKTYGCASCHQGVNVGGNMFARRSSPARENLPAPDGAIAGDDGPTATAIRSDPELVKVPSLRNVALTAPYFHDGSGESLESAVSAMGRHQLARTLSREEIDLLVKFLRTLTGATAGKPL